jgi:multiple antibiotic resistance protein
MAGNSSRAVLGPCQCVLFSSMLALCQFGTVHAFAQSSSDAVAVESVIDARKIFFMLFLMLGPIKVLVPFVSIMHDADSVLRRTVARRAILFSAAALALAGLLGRSILENFDISLPVLGLTGGVILFLVALQTVLQQSAGPTNLPSSEGQLPDVTLAFTPLAFPTIVPPYGIAAVIVFATLARGQHEAELTVVGIVLLVLALDWAAMLFAETILKWVGTTLQVFTVVLGVTQVALGLQVIMHSLNMIGVFTERAN